jgi:hypothetical protein
MSTNTARVWRQDAVTVPAAPAKIIPFPVPARVAVAVPARVAVAAPVAAPVLVHPSLGVNLVLALILLLACLLWEVMSVPSSALIDAGHTAITSPRALLDGADAAHRFV